MELTERARPAQGGTGSLTGPVLQRYQAEQAAAASAYDGAEKPGSGAPAAAGGQAFYTPADPRAARVFVLLLDLGQLRLHHFHLQFFAADDRSQLLISLRSCSSSSCSLVISRRVRRARRRSNTAFAWISES